MKIRAIPTTGNALTLGDDAVRLFIRDYSPDLPARTETIYFFGSDYPEIVSHGYAPNVRSFIVDQEHANEGAAFLFSEQNPGQVPQVCTLEITNAGGVVYLPAIRNTVKLIALNGRTTIFQYNFLCGAVSLKNPTIK